MPPDRYFGVTEYEEVTERWSDGCLYRKLFNYVLGSLFSGVSEAEGEAFQAVRSLMSLPTGDARYEGMMGVVRTRSLVMNVPLFTTF